MAKNESKSDGPVKGQEQNAQQGGLTRKDVKTAADAPPIIDGAADNAEGGPPPEQPAAQAPPRYPYSVAPGKSITSLIGIIGPGEEVKAEHLHGGQQALARLVESKVVVKS